MSTSYLFTSESVTEGHPDKICDQISDAVLDAIIAQDPACRVACEAMVTTGIAFVAGEVTTNCYVEIQDIVRDTIKSVGYTRAKYGFDSETCAVLTAIHSQSPDIAMGVDTGGAGDQGLMFGYATNETPDLMPMPIFLSHKITKRLAQVRKEGVLPYLRPDGKSQVTVMYEDGKPCRVPCVVVSAQHGAEVQLKELRDDIIKNVVLPSIPAEMLDAHVVYHINPTGRFVVGGPQGDTGVTGRKIIVDTYGGVGRHGGGAFSGKDPSKVDRSASYMARYIAKNIVQAGIADQCDVQLAYAIGVSDPVSVLIRTQGKEIVSNPRLVQAVREIFPLTPRGIIEHLNLRRPIYRKTAAYGHFGRNDPDFTWERTDQVGALKQACGL